MKTIQGMLAICFMTLTVFGCEEGKKDDNSNYLKAFIDRITQTEQITGHCAQAMKMGGGKYAAIVMPISESECNKSIQTGNTPEENRQTMIPRIQRALAVSEEIGVECVNTTSYLQARVDDPSLIPLPPQSQLDSFRFYKIPSLIYEAKKSFLSIGFTEDQINAFTVMTAEQSRRYQDFVLTEKIANQQVNELNCGNAVKAKAISEFPTDIYFTQYSQSTSTTIMSDMMCYYGSGLTTQQKADNGCATLSEEY
ncbi:hypothetical protein CH373_04095 [Leptospira perolatii]|uniref:Lipoprotein n=1 Tax=Leptospira perolatii TaxID=2023191 RepID=A0A2M9ZQB6_9LEPT|nr:hypothetical protein [Leptospira perolatii]PJZ69018.1 hypothetical protein CH360_13235 [Leptospira perolatii]PJZ74113.1 hypothetical protein CH373_04095 [Leptospira perolatii]